MTPDAAFAVEIAVVAALVVLIVAIVVASSGACREPAAGAGRARAVAVHDVERALGAGTLVTYDQAKAAGAGKGSGGGTAGESCAICLSDYAGGGELVRVLPACGHFFHAECGVDAWLRKGGTCPYCRAAPWPLLRPECAPMPPRASGPRATVGPL
ncbi:hypothetical protein C2845_PM02G06410 [Panicum miliaceum]|uniref:RING-type domain-containing protein n=1 Tax=Panicum miliaceum TaxID=4540 RepID=A0A3L6SEQ6_PANMI|nr:hypothetical protein C2845_PM02G06410 [Panicum miliaceum]